MSTGGKIGPSERSSLTSRSTPRPASYTIQGETSAISTVAFSQPSLPHNKTDDAKERSSSVVESTTKAGKGPERIWTIVLFSLIACVGSIMTGSIGGFSTNTISDIKSNADKYGITDFESDVFSSLGALGAAFGAPIAWPMSKHLGRKPALMLGGAVSLAGWLTVTYADMLPAFSRSVVDTLYVGRFITGLAGGWLIFSISIYITEISTSSLRGGLGNCNQLFVTIGVFVSEALGLLLPFDRVSLVLAGITVLFVVLLLVVSESPRWLYSHGKIKEARETLAFLRGPKANVDSELEGIRQAVEKDENITIWQQMVAFKDPQIYHPFLLSLGLMFFQQFCGINVVIFYSTQIFEQAGLQDPEIITTFLIGLLQVFFAVISVILAAPFGRKTLLLTSSVGMLVNLTVLGVYFLIHDDICHGCLGVNCTDSKNFIHENDFSPCNADGIGWVAVVAASVYVVAFALGWGPVAWTMMAELLPLRVRTPAGSIATFVNWIFAYAVTQSFKKYAQAVTQKFTWWSFGVIVVASIVFVIVLLPETKGKTLEDIEGCFEQGQVVYCDCSCVRRKSGAKRRMARGRRSKSSLVAENGVDNDLSTSL